MNLELDPRQTALVLIDLEHGIVGRDLSPHAPGDVVKRCATLAAALRTAGGTAVYVHVLLGEMTHPPADRSMVPPGAPPPPPQASELVPEAGYDPATDVLVAKRQWGAFYGTGLDQQLRRRGIRTIIMGGIATNIGVESTARAAYDRGYSLVFAEDAMTTVSKEMHQFCMENTFPLMGHVRQTAEVLQALAR